MSCSNDRDRMFHENLQRAGRSASTPAALSTQAHGRCMEVLEGGHSFARSRGVLGRPFLLSAMSLAASIALAFGLFFPWNESSSIQAATILEKLSEQISTPNMIELTIDSIKIEDASVSGHIQLGRGGIAGDIQVSIDQGRGDIIEVDAAFAVSEDGGWVLLRKISVPDPDVQPILNILLPPGTETLLLLPDKVDLPGFDIDLADALKQLSSAQMMIETFTEVILNQEDTDAVVKRLHNGDVLLTVPIKDARAIEELIRAAAMAAQQKMGDAGDVADFDPEEIDFDPEIEMFFGSTLEVLYNPKEKIVRRFSIKDFGESKGSLSVELSDRELDKDLLDPDLVSGPNTRKIDLSVLKRLVESFGG